MRFAFEAVGADRFQIAVGDLGEGAQFRSGRFGGLADDGEGVRAKKGRAAGEEVEEDGAKAVDVGGGLNWVAAPLACSEAM